MPTSPPRPVSKLAAAVAALVAVATLAAVAPVPVLGTDTAAACNQTGGSCGG
ncbi:MAG: hypothetical protein ICV64_10500 [Thermoleophilia bacterium]|nr:hypothetical protein [Thermoleophilia bacterium]